MLTHIYRRLTRGKGDAIMTRPAIISNIKRFPDDRHIAQFDNDTIDILSDIDNLELLPFIKGEHDPMIQLNGYHPLVIYDISDPCIRYEVDCISNNRPVELSRQEIFCNTVGVPFVADYNVKFTDEENTFADGFVAGMINPIGVHTKSISKHRSYPYTYSLVKKLKSLSRDVVLFDPFNEFTNAKCRRYVGTNPRQMWAVISRMSLMVCVDSFPLHAAGSTGVPIYAIFGSTDPEVRIKYNVLYSHNDRYTKCNRSYCWYFPCRFDLCMRTISPKSIVNSIIKSGLLGYSKPKNNEAVVVRIRGIGDVIMSLPAVKSLSEKYDVVTYVTSTNMAKILKCCPYISSIIGVDYNHSSSGFPDVPKVYDYKNKDVYNLINRFDFCKGSDSIERIKLIAKELKVDLSDNWRFELPYSWGLKTLYEYELATEKFIYPYVVLQLYSDGLSRLYPERYHEELIDKLYSLFHNVVLVDSKQRNYRNGTNLTGLLSFEEYVGVIKRSDLFIGVDSSGIHISGLLNKKAIGLYGSVDPKLRVSHYRSVTALFGASRCSPCNDWGKRSCSKDGKLICMHTIAPDIIYNTAKEIRQNEDSSVTSSIRV